MTLRILQLFFALALLPAAARADAYRTAAAELAGGLPAAGKVCVLPFIYLGSGSGSRGGAVVSERLNTELIKDGRLKVLERALLEKVLGDLKLKSGDTLDDAQAKKTGSLLGADYVVTGSFFKKPGGVIELNARAIEVITGQVKAAVKADISEDWLEKFPEPPGGGAGGEVFALCRAGMRALDDREFEKAADWFAKAIAAEENGACGINIPGMAYMGRAKANQHKNGLLDDYEEAPVGPSIGLTMQDQEKVRSESAENDKLVARYGALIKVMPDNAAAYFERARVFYNTTRFREARKDLDAAIRLDPRQAKYFCVRGNVLAALGLDDNALPDYDAAIRLDPGYAKAYNGRGFIYGNTAQTGKALADYGKAIELAPAEPVYYFNRASCLLKLRRYKEALNDCDKALELDPGYTEVYTRRGHALIGLKQYDLAIAAFDKALKLMPEYKPALTGRSEAYDRKNGKFDKYAGDEQKARELFRAGGD